MPGTNPDAEGSFRGNLRYLQAWHQAAVASFARGANPGQVTAAVAEGITNACHGDPALGKVQRKAIAIDPVQTFLINAWGTELLLVLQEDLARSKEDWHVIALANQWAVVQSYYAIENATVALVLAQGNVKPDSHEKTRAAYAERWQGKPYGPFAVVSGRGGLDHLPNAMKVEQVHILENVGERNCWGFIDMCLRTTRADMLNERFADARARKRSSRLKAWGEEENERLGRGRKPRKKPVLPLPRLLPSEKQAIEARVRPTSFIDYLYRLRIRSNYVDTKMFTEGPGTDFEAVQMHRYLSQLVGWNLLIIEAWIRRYVGANSFAAMMDAWLTHKVAATAPGGIVARRASLLQLP
jgi:hypothetical protein